MRASKIFSVAQELFQQIDRAAKGKIAVESLEDILCTALQRDKQHIEYGLSQLKAVLQLVSLPYDVLYKRQIEIK